MLTRGIHEFVFGAPVGEAEDWLRFWEILGFTVAREGGLDADTAGALYGHAAGLRSWQLRHAGCATFETGLVRLQG